MADDGKRAPEPYDSTALPDYMPAQAERSVKAATSHVPDPNAVISPHHMSHLALCTSNFDAVAGWWGTVLGAQPSLDAQGMRFMTFGDEHHNVVVFDMPHLKRRDQPGFENCGMHHIAWTYATFDDLVATYKRLKGEGILPFRAINHGTSFAIDYYDPDYNICELQCDCFPSPSKEGLNQWLATGAFNRNPIGVLFDFEEAIARYEAGEDIWEVLSPYRMRVGDHTQEELDAADVRKKPKAE